MTRTRRDLLDRLFAPVLAAAIVTALFVIVLSTGGCGSEANPADTAPLMETESAGGSAAPLAASGGPSISGPASLSLTRYVDASKATDLAVGKITIHLDAGTLPHSMPITLTVLDPIQNRFRIDPTATPLMRPIRVSVAISSSGTDRTSTLRFYHRSSTRVWMPLTTRQTAVDIYAYSNQFGEFWATGLGTSSQAGWGSQTSSDRTE